MKSNVKNLVNIEDCNSIIDDFINKNETNQEIHVTLAIDAASFKETRGETILKKFLELKYNNLFEFFIQPININVKHFPIHISLKENGSASKETIARIKQILKILKEKNIHVDFVATDGDRQYNSLHEDFFELILNLHKSNISFTQIIEKI